MTDPSPAHPLPSFLVGEVLAGEQQRCPRTSLGPAGDAVPWAEIRSGVLGMAALSSLTLFLHRRMRPEGWGGWSGVGVRALAAQSTPVKLDAGAYISRICNPSAPTAEGEPEPPEVCKPATLVCEEQRTTDSISSKVEDEGPHL